MPYAHHLFSQWRQSLSESFELREAEALSLMLLEDLAGADRSAILMQKEIPFGEKERGKAEGYISRLKAGEPLQYVLGYAHFAGMKLGVGPGVLIPRPETEELVQKVVDSMGEQSILEIWDACTGSGAIAIALASHWPKAQVVGSDFSAEALHFASLNGQDWAPDLCWLQQDVLAEAPEGLFDLIVSNPPYVRQQEKPLMASRVLDHEPASALFVSDTDPLVFYRSIGTHARQKLRPDGQIWFEINEALGQETVKLLTELGFHQVFVHQDIHGKDRFIQARQPD